jgi:hypothetical protein
MVSNSTPFILSTHMPHLLVLFNPSFSPKLIYAEDNEEIASESDCEFLSPLIFSMSLLKNIKQYTLEAIENIDI